MSLIEDLYNDATTNIALKQEQIASLEASKTLAENNYEEGVATIETIHDDIFNDTTGYVKLEMTSRGISSFWQLDYGNMYTGSGEGSSELSTTLDEWQIFEDVTILDQTDGVTVRTPSVVTEDVSYPSYNADTQITFDGNQSSNSQLSNGTVYYFKQSTNTYPIPYGTITGKTYISGDPLDPNNLTTVVTFSMTEGTVPSGLTTLTDLVLDPNSIVTLIWDSDQTNEAEMESRFDEFDFMIDFIHQPLGDSGSYGLKANKTVFDTGTSMLQADITQLENALIKLIRFS